MNDWGIRARVILLAVVPTAMVAAILGTYFVTTRMQDLNTNIQERGITIANYLAQTSEYSLITRNSKTLSRLVTNARDGDDDILAVAIYAKNDLLIASSGTKKLVSLLSISAEKPIVQTLVHPVETGYIVTTPIVSQPTSSQATIEQPSSSLPVIGYVAVFITNNNIQVNQYQTIAAALSILLVGVILGGILAQNMARNITIPIIQLANAVKRIKEGQLKVLIKSQSSGELKTLVDGFNDMSDSLYEAREEMQMAIEQATADINATNTALEEQNVELNIARKDAVEASRVKSEFLANMSHEIRTPMNGVIGFTNLLLRSELTEKQNDYLSTIKKSANGLLSIIDNILDFSKIEAGKMEIENRPLRIGDCVDETLNLLAPAAQAKNIEILGIVYQDVPQNLRGDAGRIGQILTNLCNNAIKFTEHGTIQIRVMLEDDDASSVRLRVNITDTGVGLSEEQQKVLFQAFTQADTTTTRRFGGTGLGLVISKKLVESMHGKIGLESEKGVGSTFWFTLKLDLDNTTEVTSELGFPGQRVLYHDANSTSQLATKYLLGQWETNVETTDSLSELLSKTRDFISTNKDIHLILVGGYSAEDNRKEFEELKSLAENAGASLAVLINSKEEKVLKRYSDVGIEQQLSKPVTRKNFYDALTVWFGFDGEKRLKDSPVKRANLSSAPAKILCVDDNLANLKLIDALLSELNVSVETADSGEKAIELCKVNEFDLIFMDIQMPGMDGLEASKQIRLIERKNKKLPIIALTAHAMKGEKERLLNQGMDDYLTKPINQTQLQENIAKWTHKQIIVREQNRQKSKSKNKTPSDSSIDWSLSLKNAGGREDLAKDMLQMLVNSFIEAKSLINQHLVGKQLDSLIAEVHKLHGATAYCGVPQLKYLTNKYESLLKTNGIDSDVKKIHDEFLKEIRKIEKDAPDFLD
jgi:two-component system sensor histidine kinase BarA